VTNLWSAKTRIGPLHFQAGCCRRWLNLALVFLCLFCVVVHFFWLVNVCFCCVTFGFSTPSQEIGLGNISKMTCFVLSGTWNHNSINQSSRSERWSIDWQVLWSHCRQLVTVIWNRLTPTVTTANQKNKKTGRQPPVTKYPNHKTLRCLQSAFWWTVLTNGARTMVTKTHWYELQMSRHIVLVQMTGASVVAAMPVPVVTCNDPWAYTDVTTLCPRNNAPPQACLKLASFVQLQFNSMNICLFSIKLPILVKICPTVIEILTFNKWSWKFTISRSVLPYLRSMELIDVSVDAIVALAKQKQTKWCLVPKILF